MSSSGGTIHEGVLPVSSVVFQEEASSDHCSSSLHSFVHVGY